MHLSEAVLERRHPEPWPVASAYYESVEQFLHSDIQLHAVHTIYDKRTPIDIFTQICPGKPCVVSFAGAIPKGRLTLLPHFSLRGIAADLNVSLIAIADPALYLCPTLTIGWYCGTDTIPLQNLLPLLLAKLIALSASPRLLFSGGSAGGFAAAYYSRLFSSSACMLWNPQINLLQYHRRLVEHYLQHAFHLSDWPTLGQRLGNYIDYDLRSYADDFFSTHPILYMQNIKDSFHVVRHLEPLITKLKRQPYTCEGMSYRRVLGKMSLLLDDWGDGHISPPRPVIAESIRHVLWSSDSWQDSFASLDSRFLSRLASHPHLSNL